MKKYRVKYFNHFESDNIYTKKQAKERIEYLNEVFEGHDRCDAHMIEIREKSIKLNCANCNEEFEINIPNDKELEELGPILCYLCNKYSRS